MIWTNIPNKMGLPRWLGGTEGGPKRHRFDPWVGKTLQRRAGQPTPVSCLENPTDKRA